MRFSRYIALTGFLVAGLISGCATSQTAKAPAEPVVEYFKLDGGKLKPGAVKVSAYYEVEKDELKYVFISPKAKAEFDRTGAPGGNSVGCLGYIDGCEDVILESELAIKEYKNRHNIK